MVLLVGRAVGVAADAEFRTICGEQPLQQPIAAAPRCVLRAEALDAAAPGGGAQAVGKTRFGIGPALGEVLVLGLAREDEPALDTGPFAGISHATGLAELVEKVLPARDDGFSRSCRHRALICSGVRQNETRRGGAGRARRLET